MANNKLRDAKGKFVKQPSKEELLKAVETQRNFIFEQDKDLKALQQQVEFLYNHSLWIVKRKFEKLFGE